MQQNPQLKEEDMKKCVVTLFPFMPDISIIPGPIIPVPIIP